MLEQLQTQYRFYVCFFPAVMRSFSLFEFKEDVLWIRTLVSFWSVLVVGNLLLAVNFWWRVVKYLSQSVAPSRVTESDSKLIIALQKAELGTLSLLPFKKLLCSGIILCLYRGINYCAAFFQNVSCFMCYRTLWMFVCVFVKCHRVCFTSSAISALKPCSSPCCINHLLVKMRRKFLQTYFQR